MDLFGRERVKIILYDDLRARAIAAAEPYGAERLLTGLYADQPDLSSLR